MCWMLNECNMRSRARKRCTMNWSSSLEFEFIFISMRNEVNEGKLTKFSNVPLGWAVLLFDCRAFLLSLMSFQSARYTKFCQTQPSRWASSDIAIAVELLSSSSSFEFSNIASNIRLSSSNCIYGKTEKINVWMLRERRWHRRQNKPSHHSARTIIVSVVLLVARGGVLCSLNNNRLILIDIREKEEMLVWKDEEFLINCCPFFSIRQSSSKVETVNI